MKLDFTVCLNIFHRKHAKVNSHLQVVPKNDSLNILPPITRHYGKNSFFLESLIRYQANKFVLNSENVYFNESQFQGRLSFNSKYASAYFTEKVTFRVLTVYDL